MRKTTVKTRIDKIMEGIQKKEHEDNVKKLDQDGYEMNLLQGKDHDKENMEELINITKEEDHKDQKKQERIIIIEEENQDGHKMDVMISDQVGQQITEITTVIQEEDQVARKIKEKISMIEEEDQNGRKMEERISVIEKDQGEQNMEENVSIISSTASETELLSPEILDFSSGSSENYIPHTSDTDESETSTSRKPKKKYTKLNVIVPESSQSDNTVIEPEPGCSNSNKRKIRKSLKERRADRESRLLLGNAGKSYVTKLGKLKPGRNLTPLTDCRMKCNSRIPHNVREFVFKEYWLLGSYDERARYTERLIHINKKKMHTMGGKTKREHSNTYKLIHFTEEYKICKGCLLKTLGESNRFLQTVCEKIKKYGRVLKSERGRAASYKKISEERLKQVEQHINKFPAYESHYSRAKTAKKYLSADLSLDAMYRLYCNENNNPVCKTVYGKVFKDMNLAFKKPSVDTCNKCNFLQNKLKYMTDPEEIQRVQEQLKKHQEDYERAYNEKRKDKGIAQNNSNTCVIAFDLQQCLPTPMLTTQSAFYKRQLWVYNLTIHDFMSNNAYCYMWPESSGGRGANQIASCLYDFITVRLPLLHPRAENLIMYSDSCSGQNKNSIVCTALLLAIKESTQLSVIEYKFLVPGHTHMEVDSDHALIEKAKKRTSMNIHHPRDWCQLVRISSNRNNKFSVIEMSENDFYDFASFSKYNFVIKKCNTEGRKFVWSNVRVLKFIKGQFPDFGYKESYGRDTDYYSMSYNKKNKDYSYVNINALQKCYKGPVPISVQKKKDLISLLEYIDPSVHEFYHNLLTNGNLRDVDPDIVSETE